MTISTTSSTGTPARSPAPHPVGPRLKIVLAIVFTLFAVLGVNAVYLLAVRGLEWQTGETYQNFFYLEMFLLHLVLGILLLLPTAIFIAFHIRNTFRRANRRAVRAGFALLAATLVLLVSGFVLTRIEGLFAIDRPSVRITAYWAHVLSPLFVAWLYVLHRLAGRRIRWRAGVAWAAAAGICALLLLILQAQDPRSWNVVGPEKGVQYFFPSLARTSTGNFIDGKILQNDHYCLECHQKIHETWAHSAHRFSSFSNPAYLFSVKETRKQMLSRHGSVQGARFCAGCHDPVPFFSGAFDDPKYDDPDYDLAADPQAQAGVTCTVCHAISHINSPRGNADFTIDEPIHYPFAFSNNPALKWVNRQLVKAKPKFHKQTFLKPLHQSAEFCGSCHKVHLPEELNDYRWLRGQNHYDSFWLSGVSGHAVASFYYPAVAEKNCNRCHMPDVTVKHTSGNPNFGSRPNGEGQGRVVTNHLFPSANTALPHLLHARMANPAATIAAHEAFLRDTVRVDVFGVRDEARIDGDLQSLLGASPPRLIPGKAYLLQVVLRTLKLGHHFTQGTSDSNEIWLDVDARLDGRRIGRSGGLREQDQAVDPWSHFVNAFVIDRHGNRINRRNAEDIFVAVYNNQIPPGAADVVNYRLVVPADARGMLEVSVALKYRKFDTEYMRYVTSNQAYLNDLPITTINEQTVRFSVGEVENVPGPTSDKHLLPADGRWNDYGIGLLRRGQLRQAEQAFAKVESFGNPQGPLNLARVYLQEGRVTTEAPAALRRARETGDGAADWSVLWFSALVNKQLGQIDAALGNLDQLVEGGFAAAQGRGFDFSQDYQMLIELADTLYVRGLRERGENQQRKAERKTWMEKSRDRYLAALALDPENADAHYGMRRVLEELGDFDEASRHAELHAKYKIDDNARDAAVAAARRKYPAANHAAEAVVIYDLHRPDAYDNRP